ncbi:MAG: hypothetical protein ACXAD7_06375 [Candidatus Kariarchaeaceae archaeon]|jgi:hypothetical protein
MNNSYCYLHKEKSVEAVNTCGDCNEPICLEHTHQHFDKNDKKKIYCQICHEILLEDKKVEMMKSNNILADIIPVIGIIGVFAILMYISTQVL